MARKKNDYRSVIVKIKLSLHPEYDTDLIEFFDSIPSYKRSQVVKSVLRGGNIIPVSVEDEDIDDLMNDLFL